MGAATNDGAGSTPLLPHPFLSLSTAVNHATHAGLQSLDAGQSDLVVNAVISHERMEVSPTVWPVSGASVEEPIAGNYFIAAYPPFSTWETSGTPAVERALERPAPARPLGLYLHLPFCQKKCDYCYYLSYVQPQPELVDRYIEALLLEVKLYSDQPAINGRPVSFVYFGGGTPSTLTTSQVLRLGCGLRSALSWDKVEEVTFECAPRSVRRDFLGALRNIGVTRLSMGIQSFDNALLKLNGRVHLAEDAQRGYKMIRGAGFEVVNLDLMVGLLGETWESWRETVFRTMDLSPESVTIYQTEIPHNTQLYRDLKSNRLPAPAVSWPEKRRRLDWAFQQLEAAGYTIASGYAALKDPEQHRFCYPTNLWSGEDMLGLGVASFGYLDGVHFQNENTLEGYLGAVGEGRLPLHRARALSRRDQFVREFVLQLKWGTVDLAALEQKFGFDAQEVFARQIRDLNEQGLLLTTGPDLALTREGLLQVDRLIPSFYDRQFQQIRYS
jgi:oxygen-independent coproporphyrinogen III oxidase